LINFQVKIILKNNRNQRITNRAVLFGIWKWHGFLICNHGSYNIFHMEAKRSGGWHLRMCRSIKAHDRRFIVCWSLARRYYSPLWPILSTLLFLWVLYHFIPHYFIPTTICYNLVLYHFIPHYFIPTTICYNLLSPFYFTV